MQGDPEPVWLLGKTSFNQVAAAERSPNSPISNAPNSTSVATAAIPAESLGNAKTIYPVIAKKTARVAQILQEGSMMKCSLRMLDVMCAIVSAGESAGFPGTGN
jgi:hypothetical protein